MDDDEKVIDTNEIEGANVKIDLTDDGDEGGEQESGSEEQIAAKGEQVRDKATGQWGKKKGDRGKQNREKVDYARRDAEWEGRFKQFQENSDRQMAALRAELQAARQQPAQRQGQQPSDPFAAKIADINTAIKTELALIEKDTSYSYDRYNQLQEQRQELIAERVAWRRDQQQAQQRQQNPPQGPNPYEARWQIMQAEHPWMVDPRYAALVEKAKHIRSSLINIEGLPDTLDTDRQAAQQAIARFGAAFGMRAPAAPSPRTRQMFEGPAPRRAPVRQEGEYGDEVEIPKELLAGSGLTVQGLRQTLRNGRS